MPKENRSRQHWSIYGYMSDCPHVNGHFMQMAIYSASNFICGQQNILAAHTTQMGQVRSEEQWICLEVNVIPLVGFGVCVGLLL